MTSQQSEFRVIAQRVAEPNDASEHRDAYASLGPRIGNLLLCMVSGLISREKVRHAVKHGRWPYGAGPITRSRILDWLARGDA